jgi:hypothetical protein
VRLQSDDGALRQDEWALRLGGLPVAGLEREIGILAYSALFLAEDTGLLGIIATRPAKVYGSA